jgi:heterodisulfide reductase subunit C/nitrate reductase gamma subunit
MSAHAESSVDGSPTESRIRPHHLAIVLGLGLALFTAISGIVPMITDWHNENAIHRVVFGDVPGPLKVVFYTVIPLVLAWGAFRFADRMKNWERGRPAQRRTTLDNAKHRAQRYRAGVYMRTLLRDPAAGAMHSMIYFGFLVLLGVTTVLEIDHQLPEDLKFLHGRTYQAYAFVGDAAGIVFLVGVVWAIVRRYVQRPYRIRIKSKLDHVLALGSLFVIAVSGFVAEMFRIALGAARGEDMDWERYSFIGYPLSKTLDDVSVGTLDTWHEAMWIVHVLAFVVFLVVLPGTMLRHMFTSPLNMYLSPKDRPKGAMKPMPNLMETELETFGASVVEDFTWKQLLDTDACTMCGRCTSVCPAHATGKPLDPREIVLKVGEVMAASGSPAVSPPLDLESEITIGSNSVFERITPEEIWACTSCKSCDEICPVNIEILDKILDMRRYLSLMESNFPSELGNAYRAM